jgi:capsular exopolysaccharide synthesis family protein
MANKRAPEAKLGTDSESGERLSADRPAPDLSIFEVENVDVVPKAPLLQALRTGDSFAGEEIRLLGARVSSLVHDRGLKSLGVVSAGPGEGKSTLSLCLATTIAEGLGRRSLVLEADLRRPSLEGKLDLAPCSGLGEWLTGEADRLLVRRVGPRGLFLISAGLVPLNKPELLASARMSQLVRAARASFDLVILDCPPLVPLADAVFLQDFVDGFLFVVRARQTPRDVLRRALANLKPELILGTVLNQQREILTSYEAKAYRQYRRER